MSKYYSWGRYRQVPQRIEALDWRFHTLPEAGTAHGLLPHGQGRSYGDVCLNDDGTLLITDSLDHFIHFDREKGLLSCESGVTLEQILQLVIPHGWFLPVTPGTRFVTLGGAIANDVHGKNHHLAGTFGQHLTKFELLRSDGSRLLCDENTNPDYFRATIGGLGLTGLVTWAELQLMPVSSPNIHKEAIKFSSLSEFEQLSSESDQDWPYTVAWLDCFSMQRNQGRGIFFRGRHSSEAQRPQPVALDAPSLLRVPFDAPASLLNKFTIGLFNTLYFHAHRKKSVTPAEDFRTFFYPLDGVRDWNRLYGKSGLFQFQCVIPEENQPALTDLLALIAKSGQGSFLSVLKKFADRPSPGMLSFPRPGITLALDFANRGDRTLALLRELEKIVFAANGAIYPAKDAIMSAESYQAFYPAWQQFSRWVDPGFSSSFWRRVSGLKV